VLPGLSGLEYEVVEKGLITHLLNPTYAAVATPKVLSDLSAELGSLSQRFDKVIFIKGENDLGIVEHSLLHELGHISYQLTYPEKVNARQVFYQKLRQAVQKANRLSYLMSKVYSLLESDPRARVLLSLESDELYSNRFAYRHNTDRSAYVTLAERELQIALRAWNKMDIGRQFESAFHMVLVDLYMRVLDRSWVEGIPFMFRWLLPYTSTVVDAVDAEDPAALFTRQVLLFNAINRWIEITEDDIRQAVYGST
jgi:hypothetical protein